MKVLQNVTPTPEQLLIIRDTKPGTLVVRGAAGSGKTTTGLLRLRQLGRFWSRRKRDGDVAGRVRILVLTFNRTLRGYIEALAEEHGSSETDVDLTISTFGKWAFESLARPAMADAEAANAIWNFGWDLGFDRAFLLDEIDYMLGRFLPQDLDDYLTTPRTGRGTAPRVSGDRRRRLLDEVSKPYERWKLGRGVQDWNDLAVQLALDRRTEPYHVIIVDEAQDFSANQIRAILNHLDDEHTLTFIIDSTQRIYPRHFRWHEVGLDIGPRQVQNLSTNYRNTRQIAAFALPLVEDLEADDDGTLPDFEACRNEGPLPVVVSGRFSDQMDWIIKRLETSAQEDPNQSSVILHALGGGWFNEVRRRLTEARIDYVEIARESEWPRGPENVALSTMHSVKGLEFDHVYIVGLNAEVTPHGVEPGDAMLENYRRLLAMAIGRARRSVTVSFKPGEASSLVEHLRPGTFELVER